jgi:hypothetical protein
MKGKISLKLLENKVYRIFNRLNIFIHVHYQDSFEHLLRELQAFKVQKKSGKVSWAT